LGQGLGQGLGRDPRAPAYLGNSRARGGSTGNPDWWSGFYLGGTLGHGMGRTSVDGDAGRFSNDQSGGTIGLLGGYNWSTHGFLVGVEGDAKIARISGSAIAGGNDIEQNLRWMGTMRVRAGVLAAPALLIYGLAGVSAADITLRGAVLGGGKADELFLGLQVGGGAEVKLTEQWSLRAEYTYTNFAKEQAGSVGSSNNFDPSIHAIQAGIVYRF
jgi:outer membrane immunogenic protein